MTADKIRSYLKVASTLLPVDLYYYDLTAGETTECFVAIGGKENFPAIEIFCAAAIDAIERYRSGDSAASDWDSDAMSQLVAVSTPPPLGCGAPEIMMEPGKRHFPPQRVLGFDPPRNISERLTLEGISRCVENCTVGESQESYVFCYWYTTG